MFGLCVFLICSRYRTEAGWERSPCRVAVLQVEAFQNGLEVVFLRDVRSTTSQTLYWSILASSASIAGFQRSHSPDALASR